MSLLLPTDDGHLRTQGVVTIPLKELLESGKEKVGLVVAIGPTDMDEV